MAKYTSFLWLNYLCTIICLLPCLGRQIDSSTQGASCADNQYGIKSEDGKIKCKSCDTFPDCPHGLGVSISCGDVVAKTVEIHCIQCVLGKTFSEGHDRLPCKKCKSTSCYKNEKILGSCKVDNDTSSCGGVCKKGFYPRDGDLSHCQPCSRCCNNASIPVKKCKDDGWPVEKQCEMVSCATIPSEKPGPFQPGGKRKNHYIYRGYKVYGHPLLLTFFVILSFGLVLSLAVTCCCLRRKFRKKRRLVSQQPEELVSLASDANDAAPSADSGSNETVSFDVSSNTSIVRKRISSTSSSGSGGQKFSVSRQNSCNFNAGSDIKDEEAPRSSVAGVQVSEARNDLQDQPSQRPGERQRTVSQGSSGRRSSIFRRQNSNPMPEHAEEKPFQRRSSTFSNFSTVFSGQKMRNKEETVSLLSQTDHDDDFEPPAEALPNDTEEGGLSFVADSEVFGEDGDFQPLQKPERKRKLSQGSRRRNSILSRQNSNPNPIPEHGEEEPFHKRSTQKMGNKEETNSLLSNTDCNENNLEPLVVALPDKTKARHQLSGVKIGELNAEKYRELCNQLNSMPGWEVLAGYMSYSNAEVKIFGKDKNPADKLLTSWDVGKENDVAGLIELVRGMKRLDIVELLESHPDPRALLL